MDSSAYRSIWPLAGVAKGRSIVGARTLRKIVDEEFMDEPRCFVHLRAQQSPVVAGSQSLLRCDRRCLSTLLAINSIGPSHWVEVLLGR